jgi:adenylosuccinate lyase
MAKLSILANRYASPEMRNIFSAEFKIKAERDLWIEVAKAQKKFGLKISDEQLRSYEEVKNLVNIDSIDQRERILRHDVMARIQEFNELAGHEVIHTGMTSRDLTENVEALQIRLALNLINEKVVALLARLGEKATLYLDQPVVGRSHNVPAQITTVGKRFATCAEELIYSYERLQSLLTRFPMRGIKGPVGTSQDSLDIVGKYENHLDLERTIALHLGFERVLDSTGQIYPRSLDYEIASCLVQIGAAPSSLATTIRLMAGSDLVTEGFSNNQVGSTAMPHKMNTRSCERINGLLIVLKGYSNMLGELAGNQWNEGDVSCSVVRRVAISEAFYAIDGLLETVLTVLSEFEIFAETIMKEIENYLPFLATTRLLMAAVKNGGSRELAHKVIREYSTKASVDVRHGRENLMLTQIADDSRIPLTKDEIDNLLKDLTPFTGAAKDQTKRVINKIHEITSQNQDAARYKPHQIR